MRKLLSFMILSSAIICCFSCLRLFPDKIEPPEWFWGEWEGYFADTSELSESTFWTVSEDKVQYGYADGDPEPVFSDTISGYEFDDGYTKDSNGRDQYTLELVAGTSAYRKYIFTRINEESIELLEVRDLSPRREYTVILTRKQ